MNSSENISTSIPKRQMTNFANGLIFACRRGTPPTRLFSLNVDRIQVPAHKFNTKFLDLAGRFLAYHGAERVHFWVLEKPFGGPLNFHILLHIPKTLEKAFIEREKDWARKAGLPDKLEGVDKLNPFDAQQLRGRIGTTHFHESVDNCGSYMLKGGSPDVCETMGIAHYDQGKVLGQRCGLSEAIDTTARKRAGFTDYRIGSEELHFPWRYSVNASDAGRINK